MRSAMPNRFQVVRDTLVTPTVSRSSRISASASCAHRVELVVGSSTERSEVREPTRAMATRFFMPSPVR
jgi:hypothetical protein